MSAESFERLLKPLLITGAVLLVLDLFIDTYPYVPRHGVPWVYAFLGFSGFLAVMWCAQYLAPWLRKPEDYYASDDDEPAGTADVSAHPDEKTSSSETDHRGAL